MPSSGAYSSGRIRSGVKAVVIGKAFSAPATFLLILYLAAVMPRTEYAAYIGATAVLEIAIFVGTFGIDWLISTTIASARVRGGAGQLRATVRLLGRMQLAVYLAVAALLWFAAPVVSSVMSGVVPAEVLRIYAVVLAIDGPGRMLRDQMLGALLLQRSSQISSIARVLFVCGAVLAVKLSGNTLTAAAVGYAEVAASAVSMLIAWFALRRYLAEEAAGGDDKFRISQLLGPGSFRLAAHAYFSILLMMCLGTEVVTTVVARYLGAEATAIFGFVARLMETGKKYLPMDFLYGVLRPATIGRFEHAGRDFDVLDRDVNFMLKANVVAAGAGMSIAVACGSELVRLLSKGSIDAPHFFLAAMISTVFSHTLRRVVELVAFLVGRSQLFMIGSSACTLVPLLLALVLARSPSLYWIPAVIIFADTLFCGFVLVGLRSHGYRLRIDWVSAAKMLFGVLVGGVLGHLLAQVVTLPGAVVAGALLSLLLYVVLLRVTNAVDMADLARLGAMVRPKAAVSS